MKRILFVDDEPNVLEGLQRALRPMKTQWGMEFASSGQEALDTLALRPFDVVVSDMRMPRMTGAELLDKVKERFPQTTRIILSGDSDRGFILQWIATGHLFLSKTCCIEKLVCILKGSGSTGDLAASTAVTNATARISSDKMRVVLHEGTMQDSTEHRQDEVMLENSKNRYRLLFEASGDANWVMDEKGFVDCNSAALRMFGYSAGALIPHPADISPLNQPDGSDSRVAAQQKMASAFLNGKERFEWMHQRKNGEVFPAEVCLAALMLSGRPMLLVTVRDITVRKQAEEALLFKTALLPDRTNPTVPQPVGL